jgi:hypothetical protein
VRTIRTGITAADTLTGAAVEALTGEFPRWRIWVDGSGWHAIRRGPYVQQFNNGAPAFSVHAPGPVQLAAQLCWQQAGDAHAPRGCPRW